MENLPRNLFIASIVLFLISLVLPACGNSGGDGGLGLALLLFGPLGLLAGEAIALSWLANPLLFAAWITFKKNVRISFLLSVFAFLASAYFLGFDEMITGSNGLGTMREAIEYRFGYWFWLASTAAMMVGTGIQIIDEMKQKKKTKNAE